MERSYGFPSIKNVAQKNLIIGHLQIDTLPTQKLELTYHELSCSRLERQIFNFLSKLAVRFVNLKANLLKKSQKIANFLHSG